MKKITRNSLIVLISAMLILVALPLSSIAFSVEEEGWCGENVSYKIYSNGEVVLSGSGPMYNYSYYSYTPVTEPWTDNYTSDEYTEWNYPWDEDYTMEENTDWYGPWNEEYTTEEDTDWYGPWDEEYTTEEDTDWYGPWDEEYTTERYEGLTDHCCIPWDEDYTMEEGTTYWNDPYDPWYEPYTEGYFYLDDMSPFAYNENITKLTVKSGVTTIGTNAFIGCENLKEIDFGDIEIIYDDAFYNCNSLEKIELPGTIKTVKDAAASSCRGLKTVIFSEGVERIEGDPFLDCDLYAALLPQSLEYLCGVAFWLSGVDYIFYAGTEEMWYDLIAASDGYYDFDSAVIIFNATEIIELSTDPYEPTTDEEYTGEPMTYTEAWSTIIYDDPTEKESTTTDNDPTEVTTENVTDEKNTTETKIDDSTTGTSESTSAKVDDSTTGTSDSTSAKADDSTTGTSDSTSAKVDDSTKTTEKVDDSTKAPESSEKTTDEKTTSAPGKEYSVGDINRDGKTNSSDARFILRVSARLEKLADNLKALADANGDGKINSSDARKVLRIAAKLEPAVSQKVLITG
ncbi:MAG: leucine-rich repeat protein [Clostridia bacterium]|nr:leucine-rich repeat protein [Clostridia bacterium]